MNRVQSTKRPVIVTTRVNGVGLAGDLFQQHVGIDPAYLKKPSSLCSRGCFADHLTNRIVPQRCKLRTCSHCRKLLAWRIVEQVCYQSIETYAKIEIPQWTAYRKYIKRNGSHYKMFPQSEFLIVVSTTGDQGLPIDKQTLIELVDSWIAGIPRDKRISGSRKFGGDTWSNCRQRPQRSRYQYIGRDIDVILAEERAYLKRALTSLTPALDGGCTFTKEAFNRIIAREDG